MALKMLWLPEILLAPAKVVSALKQSAEMRRDVGQEAVSSADFAVLLGALVLDVIFKKYYKRQGKEIGKNQSKSENYTLQIFLSSAEH